MKTIVRVFSIASLTVLLLAWPLHAQTPPPPVAAYESPGGSPSGPWDAIQGTGSGTPLTGTPPPPVGLYCSSDGTGNPGTWVPWSTTNCGGGSGGSGFPIVLGSTSIAASSTTTAVTGLSVNGVTLNAAGSSTLFLNQAGGYTTPSGGGAITLTAPTGFSVSGSPLTPPGTLGISTSGLTANDVLKAVSGGIGNSQLVDDGTHPVKSPNGFDIVTAGAYDAEIPNNAVTGTTVQTAACNDGSQKAIICPHTTSTTNQPIGFVVSGAGTTGNATICPLGWCQVLFDNTSVANDYAISSSTVDGELHDTGSSTTQTANQPNYIVWSANAGAGTAAYVRLLTANDFSASTGGGTGGGGAVKSITDTATARGDITFTGSGVSQSGTTFTFSTGSGGISGLTAGFLPIAGSATTITANSHIDDGVTTAGVLTHTESDAWNVTGTPTQFNLIPSGTSPATVTGAASLGVPNTVTTPGVYLLPAAPGSGLWTATNASGIVTNTFTAIQGTDTKVLSSGTVSGTSALLCTDANGGATTSSCPTASGGAVINLSSVITPTGCAFSSGACVVSGTTTTAISFTSIPTSYNILRMVFALASNNTTDALGVQFNGDTTSGHYGWQFVFNNSTTSASAFAATAAQFQPNGGGNVPTSASGQLLTVTCDIALYASTSFQKTIICNGSSPGTVIPLTGFWTGTAAITSFNMFLTGANAFKAGSAIMIYGVQ